MLATYKGKLTEIFKSVIIWTYRAVKKHSHLVWT